MGMFGKKKEDPEKTALVETNEEEELVEEPQRFNYILYLVGGAYALLQGGNVFYNVVIAKTSTSTHPGLLTIASVLLLLAGVGLFAYAGKNYLRESKEAAEFEQFLEDEAAKEAAKARKEFIAKASEDVEVEE